MSGPVSIGVVGDLLEEGWPSMDLAAELIGAAIDSGSGRFRAEILRPPMRRWFSRLRSGPGLAFNGDRALNRFWHYPRWLRTRTSRHALYHIVDHSYAHLALELPPGRVVVTCHDLDAFRPLWQTDSGSLHRCVARKALEGLRRAALVVCPSEVTRSEIESRGLAPARVLRVAPNPVHPCFEREPGARARTESARLLLGDGPFLLHVGSNIARKRVDVLLRAFALTRRRWPSARLVRTGPLTATQGQQATDLGIADALIELPYVDQETLASIYGRAALTLLPSEREGFGWPMVESLSRGTPVVASDIPVFRETGGKSAVYAAPGDPADFSRRMDELLEERAGHPDRWRERQKQAIERSRGFGMAAYSRSLLSIYRELEDTTIV